MKRTCLAVAAMVLMAGCSVPTHAASVYERSLDSTVSLTTVVDGAPMPFCAGAILSPHEILTASHCMVDMDKRPVMVDGVLVEWSVVRQDKADHIVIKVDTLLEGKPVKLAKKALGPGDKVFYYGHPYGVPSLLYREGYVAGRERIYNTDADFYSVQAWKGDSGAPIFNQKGEVVGTVSIVFGEGAFHLMGSFPYAWEE